MLRQIARKLKRAISPPHQETPGEKSADYYDRLYDGSASYNAHPRLSHYYFLWCVIADRVRAAGHKRILEVGCGPAQLAQVVRELSPAVEFSGFDFSPVAVQMAQADRPWGRWWVGDARDAANFAGLYDCVICTEVLEHIEDDLAVMANIPSGVRCLCTVPNFEYESHVRTFADAAAVVERYGRFFREPPTVVSFRSPKSHNDLFHLFDGISR